MGDKPKLTDLPDAEAFKKLFPKKVRDRADQIANEARKPATRKAKKPHK